MDRDFSLAVGAALEILTAISMAGEFTSGYARPPNDVLLFLGGFSRRSVLVGLLERALS